MGTSKEGEGGRAKRYRTLFIVLDKDSEPCYTQHMGRFIQIYLPFGASVDELSSETRGPLQEVVADDARTGTSARQARIQAIDEEQQRWDNLTAEAQKAFPSSETPKSPKSSKSSKVTNAKKKRTS